MGVFKVQTLTLRAFLLPRPSEPWLVGSCCFIGIKKAGVPIRRQVSCRVWFLNVAKVVIISELANIFFCSAVQRAEGEREIFSVEGEGGAAKGVLWGAKMEIFTDFSCYVGKSL